MIPRIIEDTNGGINVIEYSLAGLCPGVITITPV